MSTQLTIFGQLTWRVEPILPSLENNTKSKEVFLQVFFIFNMGFEFSIFNIIGFGQYLPEYDLQ